MCAFLQPLPLHQRLGGQSGAADDVAAAHSGFQIGHGFGLKALLLQIFGQAAGFVEINIPNAHVFDVAHGGISRRNFARHIARAHNQQALCILARQIIGGQRRSGGRAAAGDLVAVEHRHRHAVLRVKQSISGMQPRQAVFAAVFRINSHMFDAQKTVFLPGGHNQ